MSLRITLWGQRAKDFSISDVVDKDSSKLIVILLVGCLAKHFQGSTSSVCLKIGIPISMDIRVTYRYFYITL
jgi:hypothetical protein